MKHLKKILVASLAASVIACGGAEDRKAVYMDKALQSMKLGDLDKARIELKNVLQIDPKDAEAYFQLGKVMEAKQDFRKAFGNYNKAAELDPDNPEYKAKIGRFYLVLANDAAKAEEQLEAIEKVDANNRHGKLLKAGILFKKGDAGQATAILEQLNTQDPSDTEVAKFLAQIHSKNKDYGKSQKVLKAAIAAHPNDTTLLNMLAQAYMLAKDADNAEKTLRKVVDIKPEVLTHYVNLARFYQTQGEIDKAEQTLLNAIQEDEDDIKRKMTYLDFIQQAKSKEEAIRVADRFYADKPQPELLSAKASLQLALENKDGAIATYEEIAKRFSEEEAGIKARVALASHYAGESDIAKAKKIIEEALSIAPNDASVNMVVAKIAVFEKDYDKAVASLRTVVKDNPENIEAYILLARSHLANGDKAQHDTVIQNALENNRGNTQAMEVLAAYHLKQGDTDKSLDIVNSIAELKTNDYKILSQQAALLNKKRTYNEAFEIAEKLRNLAPAEAGGYAEAIPYLLNQKKYDEAIAMLQQGYDKTGDARLLVAAADIELKTGKFDSVIQRITSTDDYQNSEAMTLQLSRAYFAKGDKAGAEKILRDVLKRKPLSTTTRLALAGIKKANADVAGAIRLLEEGEALDRKSAKLRMTLAGLYDTQGQYDKAIGLYEAILETSPNDVVATNNLAALLADHRDDEQSLARALELAKKLKNMPQPVLKDTLGWVYYKNGKYDEAVKVLKEVVAASPDIAVFNYHLGMALLKSGDKTAAKQYLQSAVDSRGDFKGRQAAKQALSGL